MRTFVLSGGGNRGPLQVGALRVLLEHGIAPQMIVGSSAGAINGAILALNPKPEQTQVMAELWRDAGRAKVIRTSPARSAYKLARKRDHLADNARLRARADKVFPPNRRAFGQLAARLYVTIAHLRTHTLYVYGDDPDANVIDAIVTSAAIPGFFPPTRHKGEVFVDGGVVSNLPLCLAMSRGATEIWALDLAFDIEHERVLNDSLALLNHAVRPIMYANALRELEQAEQNPNVVLHHVAMHDFQDVAIGDFGHTEDMIEAGARVMRDYLAQQRPNAVRRPRRYSPADLPEGPPGSRPFLDLAA